MRTALLIISLVSVSQILLCNPALGGVSIPNLAAVAPPIFPACGSVYSSPIADSSDDAKPRQCPDPVKRTYIPKYRTIGHEVLSSESEACFVPDSAFEELDALIEAGQRLYKSKLGNTTDWSQSATSFFEVMGNTLVNSGYQLYIPTDTLGDALVTRSLRNQGKHIADCDTASLLYLSLAETLKLPVSMVEIELPSGAGHNYLRWVNPEGQGIDWDTNGRERRVAPNGLPAWQGRSMSRSEVIGYTKGIRGLLYQKSGRNAEALADYREDATLYSRSPAGHNNLAWLIATRQGFDSPAFAQEAIGNAVLAVSIERTANYLDTLACSYARAGNFDSAVSTAREVLTLNPSSEEFKQRLARFQATPPKTAWGLSSRRWPPHLYRARSACRASISWSSMLIHCVYF
ncbi:tetratricopeptide repeat protein [Paraburkholderia sp. IW21]|uniref:tetratricopeptide repeat protein n=1 Tax=Paraburkholderia sp. IW21 TaxID=3242488 RepID=UPI0035221F3C